MAYTLWSRGRLLGETELAYRQAMPGLRAGDFFPTEMGEQLMPIIDGMSPALFALYDVEQEALRANPNDRRIDGWPAAVLRTTEYADVMSIADERESLRLELRDPNGVVIEAEDLWVRDTHRLLALSDAASVDDLLDDADMTDEMRASIDHDVQIMLEHFESLEARAPWETGDQPWDPHREADDDGHEKDEADFPRYQIFVRLAGLEPFADSSYQTE